MTACFDTAQWEIVTRWHDTVAVTQFSNWITHDTELDKQEQQSVTKMCCDLWVMLVKLHLIPRITACLYFAKGSIEGAQKMHLSFLSHIMIAYESNKIRMISLGIVSS